MSKMQPGILDSVPPHGRYLFFDLFAGADPRPSLQALANLDDGDRLVVGMGQSLILALGAGIEGLRVCPALVGKGLKLPSTPSALWCWLRGEDRGDLPPSGAGGRADDLRCVPAGARGGRVPAWGGPGPEWSRRLTRAQSVAAGRRFCPSASPARTRRPRLVGAAWVARWSIGPVAEVLPYRWRQRLL